MGTDSQDHRMVVNKQYSEERHSLIVLKNETKLVMEAFLQRMVMLEEAKNVGHVGRYYHDSRKFISTSPKCSDSNSAVKAHIRRKSNHKGSLEREAEEEKKRSLKRTEGAEDNDGWDTADEEIAKAEEKKHGFRTTIKRLIRRQRKKKSSDKSVKKSKDSLDLLEDEGSGKHGSKCDSKTNSVKRQKSPNHLISGAHSSIETDTSNVKEEATEEIGKHSSRKSGTKRLLNLFRKHSQGKIEDASVMLEKEQEPRPSRPNTLHLMTDQMSSMDKGSAQNENVEFYSKVAKKLDKLAQQYCAQSDIDRLSPSIENRVPEIGSNNVPQNAATDKEKMIEKIVLLLQQQGDGINEKMKEDPALQRTMSRMSYRSFSHLVEAFTANVEEQHGGPTATPELTKIALTMELTRRVAGISSHPVQQLMGYSMQYMNMFVPWLQENGGWTMVLPMDDDSEYQID
ncbi:uncharacterized protein bcl2l12 [Rhincodon typus]|uniref:uncharacterized protein bcl2l12 n=1 Tax=Rhincodon typus TaxID=259920 RepID=UPI0009A3C090|nr:uncharacterized protein bcl2l12 [Rhincodon typus]